MDIPDGKIIPRLGDFYRTFQIAVFRFLCKYITYERYKTYLEHDTDGGI